MKQGAMVLMADFNAKLEMKADHVKQNKSRNGKLLEKLMEDTKLTPFHTQEVKCKWTRQNYNNPMEKSVRDCMLVSKKYETSIEEIADEVTYTD